MAVFSLVGLITRKAVRNISVSRAPTTTGQPGARTHGYKELIRLAGIGDQCTSLQHAGPDGCRNEAAHENAH
jgi:hypothetical protein